MLGFGGYFTTQSTQWGLDNEAEALPVYETTVKPYHIEVKLKWTVFLVIEKCPYIGASPDRVRPVVVTVTFSLKLNAHFHQGDRTHDNIW